MWAIIAILVALLYLYFKKKFSYWTKRGLSNPPAYPFVGNSIFEVFFWKKESEWDYFNKYGRVFGTYNGTKPVFNTSDPEHIKQVLAQDDIFHSRTSFVFNDKYLKNSLLLKNGPDWKQARSSMSHFFTSSKLRNLMSHYKSVTDNFIKNVDTIRKETGNDLINIRLLTKCFGIDMIARIIMAVDIDSYNQKDSDFVKHATKLDEIIFFRFLLLMFIPSKVSDFFQMSALNSGASDSLGDMFKKLLRERQNKGTKFNDLTEQMQEYVKEKNIDIPDDHIIGNAVLNFFAGVDNISNNLCFVLLLLIENPEVKEKLCEELKKHFSDEITYQKLVENAYLDAVVKEASRLNSVVNCVERLAVKDTRIGEFEIEKGTTIMLIFKIPHTHPDYYPEPEKFLPERFLDKSSMNKNKMDNSPYFAFGHGNKNCIGMRLANIEIKYFLVRTLLEYDIYKPENFKRDQMYLRPFSNLKSCQLCFKKKD